MLLWDACHDERVREFAAPRNWSSQARLRGNQLIDIRLEGHGHRPCVGVTISDDSNSPVLEAGLRVDASHVARLSADDLANWTHKLRAAGFDADVQAAHDPLREGQITKRKPLRDIMRAGTTIREQEDAVAEFVAGTLGELAAEQLAP